MSKRCNFAALWFNTHTAAIAVSNCCIVHVAHNCCLAKLQLHSAGCQAHGWGQLCFCYCALHEAAGCGLATAWQRLSCQICVHIIHICMHFLLDDQIVVLWPAHVVHMFGFDAYATKAAGLLQAHCCTHARMHSASVATRPLPSTVRML
jgi:hypothetical protein